MSAPQCAGKRHDKRFGFDIACDALVTVERDGTPYCPGHDPQGEYVTQRDDFHRASSVARAKHLADAAQELQAQCDAMRAAITGELFAFREAMYLHLHERIKAGLGRSLAASEIVRLHIIVNEHLWPEHARAHGVDVRRLTARMLSSIQLRWWLPDGAAEPVRTERGPLSIPEKEALWSYCNAHLAHGDTAMDRFHGVGSGR